MTELQQQYSEFPNEYSPKEMKARALRVFLDFYMLLQIMKYPCLGAYDIINKIQNEFHQSISPGTIYSILYEIERKKLIESIFNGKKTVFKITNLGKMLIESMNQNKAEISGIFLKIISFE